jgi:Flp pilus assembly protein TadG
VSRFRRSQRGFIAAEFALGVGLLLIPIGLLVITLPVWPARQSVARVAATEAARTAVQQTTLPQAVAAGDDAARQVAQNYGVDPAELTVVWRGDVARGSAMTAVVNIRMPAIAVPALGGVGAWTWTVAHTEKVDAYRSYP